MLLYCCINACNIVSVAPPAPLNFRLVRQEASALGNYEVELEWELAATKRAPVDTLLIAIHPDPLSRQADVVSPYEIVVRPGVRYDITLTARNCAGMTSSYLNVSSMYLPYCHFY